MTQSDFTQCLDLIRSIAGEASNENVLISIESVAPDLVSVDSILYKIKELKSYPDTIFGILLLLNGMIHKKKEISKLYEGCMDKYNQINSNIAKNKTIKPSDEEIKIKGTLSDFIIKIESFFESHDRADENMLKGLGNYMNESNLHGKTDIEILYMNLPAYLISSIISSLDAYAELANFYAENMEILQRLINIANLILAESVNL